MPSKKQKANNNNNSKSPSSSPKGNKSNTKNKKGNAKAPVATAPSLPVLGGSTTPKIVYMIRHGQSLGQVATKQDRKHSPDLIDCDLSSKGKREASCVQSYFNKHNNNNDNCNDDIDEYESIQLVISSPLTRALHTSLLAFPTKHILVDYRLAEIGTGIPENMARPMDRVLKDLERSTLGYRDTENLMLDVTTLQPEEWPPTPDAGNATSKGKNGGKKKSKGGSDNSNDVNDNDGVTNSSQYWIQQALKWIASEREESVIAIVCHYNVIREAIRDGAWLSPANALPIRCHLHPNGDLVLA